MTKEETRYTKFLLNNGYLFLCENLSEILKLQNELKNKKIELKKSNSLLKNSEKVKIELLGLQEKKKIIDEINDKIEYEREELTKEINELPDKIEEKDRQNVEHKLAFIKVETAFLKQKCMLLLNGKFFDDFSANQIQITYDSLLEDCKSLGFDSAFSIVGSKSLMAVDLLFFNEILLKIFILFAFLNSSVFVNINNDISQMRARIVCKKDIDTSKLLLENKNYELKILKNKDEYEVTVRRQK